MKRIYISVFSILILTLFARQFMSIEPDVYERLEKKQASMDYLLTMRSFPDETYDQTLIFQAIENEKAQAQQKAFEGDWTIEGPLNIGGRINSIAVSPNTEEEMMVGLSYGGIYKTTNGGDTWNPVFDEEVDQSISEIVYDPNNAQKVWVGTGDKSVPFTAFTGNGVYVSENAGGSWENKGLNEMGIIGKLVIDSENSNTLFAAALGVPMSRDNNRGLYKSTDGGNSWSQTLFVNDSTGIVDVHQSSNDPNVLYACSWTRLRTNRLSLITSTENKIFKSVDRGETWSTLSNGLPSGEFSKIHLSVAPQNGNRLYALYIGDDFNLSAIYSSNDAGASWFEYFGDGIEFNNFGWYFDQVVVDPTNENNIYVLNVELHKITNGTASTFNSSSYHADCHELLFLDNKKLLLGTDGGLFTSTNTGASNISWDKIDDIPITQYYRVAYNPAEPSLYIGGAQDNSMSKGNASDIDGWEKFSFGDGFQPFYLENRSEYFSESQFGSIRCYTDTDASSTGSIGTEVGESIGWNVPYHVDEDLVMTIGAQSVYTIDWEDAISSNGNITTFLLDYVNISPQLTDPDEPYHSSAHVITGLDRSTVDPNIIFAGTGDGRVWISSDDGNNWSRVDANLPERFVTSVKCSPVESDWLYVTYSGYKDLDQTPHVYVSKDRGNSWESVAGNLPDIAINDIYVLPERNDQVLFVGTDIGVYGSIDGGLTWDRIGANMPFIPVYDVDYNPSEDRLAAATFGRSIMTFPMEEIAPSVGIDNPYTELEIYPNPSEGLLNITASENLDLRVFNLLGEQIFFDKLERGNNALQLQNVAAGTYLIQTSTQGKITSVAKWVKN